MNERTKAWSKQIGRSIKNDQFDETRIDTVFPPAPEQDDEDSFPQDEFLRYYDDGCHDGLRPEDLEHH